MEAFHNRLKLAGENGFAAGFPNFIDSHIGFNHLGGTIFLRSAAVEWRDVPIAELENVPLNDFAASATEHLPLELDGEQEGTTPARFEVVPHALARAGAAAG